MSFLSKNTISCTCIIIIVKVPSIVGCTKLAYLGWTSQVSTILCEEHICHWVHGAPAGLRAPGLALDHTTSCLDLVHRTDLSVSKIIIQFFSLEI